MEQYWTQSAELSQGSEQLPESSSDRSSVPQSSDVSGNEQLISSIISALDDAGYIQTQATDQEVQADPDGYFTGTDYPGYLSVFNTALLGGIVLGVLAVVTGHIVGFLASLLKG